ncbi:general secretion pathway protein GspK [Immundisolibacter sp.]|uniref:general secretion pathway protein GspK n=1 Tax=Immundisolibacter sp. TaxID=1934948 RepID=UPI00261C8622|nr:type II secretion system protein GspK [Immundisolibacter sp.]MDD3650719.1 type II secretion system protein GspK [Immundisolibacter sp.]
MPARQRGVALAAVLWMVAALSVLALGLAATARTEVRSAQGVRARAEAAALGDGAIQLAVLELRSAAAGYEDYRQFHYLLGEREIIVTATPAGGLIDLNQASEELLAALFAGSGGVDPEQAAQLAHRVLAWRTPGLAVEAEDYAAAGVAFRPRGGPFEYPEDLLQVLGVDYDLYVKVRGLITVRGGSAGVAPKSASEAVLTLLAGGDQALAARIALQRGEDPATDFTALDHRFVAGGGSPVYRMEARVRIGDRSYVRTRWLDLSAAAPDGRPWRSFRVEAVTGN